VFRSPFPVAGPEAGLPFREIEFGQAIPGLGYQGKPLGPGLGGQPFIGLISLAEEVGPTFLTGQAAEMSQRILGGEEAAQKAHERGLSHIRWW